MSFYAFIHTHPPPPPTNYLYLSLRLAQRKNMVSNYDIGSKILGNLQIKPVQLYNTFITKITQALKLFKMPAQAQLQASVHISYSFYFYW